MDSSDQITYVPIGFVAGAHLNPYHRNFDGVVLSVPYIDCASTSESEHNTKTKLFNKDR